MKKERKVWAISLIAFWWLAPNLTNAQQEQDSVQTLSDVVVVTATKFPKSQVETGKVLTVIDEAQLTKSEGKDISQLLNEQVGLIINGANSNTGKDKSVYLRGASTKYTLILIDGIPISDPSGVGGAFDLRMLPIDQVERIEILKGSQSTLYGTDAIAGVVNIITKRKGDKPFGASALASYGSYNTWKANVGVNGSTSAFDYNLSYTRFQTDGISEAKDPDNTGTFDDDGYTQNAVQLNLGISPTENLSLRPFIRYSDFDGKYDGGAFVDDNTAVFTSSFLNYGLSGQYKLGKGSANLLYSHSTTDRTYKSAFGTYPYEGNFDNAEVFVNHDLGQYFQILAGLNYQYQKMNVDDPALSYRYVNITSPYVSLFLNDLQGFSMEVGGRYNDHSTFGNAFTYSINPSYLINNQLKIFANYSTGFKAPTLSELYGPWGANDKLQPEESESPEAGVQYIGKNGKFDVRATFYKRKIKNVITTSSVTYAYINLNEQNDKGFEIEPTVKVNDHITVKAFYAYVTGDVTTKTLDDRDTTYNNLLRRPEHSIGINIGYQVTPSLFVSVNYKTFSERKDSFFDNNDYSTSLVSLSAYQLLDCYVDYSFLNGKVKLFADVKNILNQDYMEVYGYNTMRFNINAGLSCKL